MKSNTALAAFALLLARTAAGGVIRVNFRSAGHPPPLRMGRETYLSDVGLAFGERGDRGGGRSYGWSSSNAKSARRRYLHPDCRCDGFIGMSGRTWEIALEDGDYDLDDELAVEETPKDAVPGGQRTRGGFRTSDTTLPPPRPLGVGVPGLACRRERNDYHVGWHWRRGLGHLCLLGRLSIESYGRLRHGGAEGGRR